MRTDPYKYFRVEARELLEGLTQGVLELEKGASDQSLVGRLLRLAHTLKGASRVVRQSAIAELAHELEDVLSPFRDTSIPVPCELAKPVLNLLDRMGRTLELLDGPSPGGAAPASRIVAEEPLETVRVDVEEVDDLLGSLSETAVMLRKMDTDAAALAQAHRLANQLVQQMPASSAAGGVRSVAEELSASIARLARRLAITVDEAQRETAITRERANHLRLLAAHSIFPSIVRAVRDAATALGKEAELETTGGEIRLDAHVLLTMRDAILHLVRNAVAHGVELPSVRSAVGKPPRGRILLMIERRGNEVVFTCRDDGGGIDLQAIRLAAVKKGAIQPAAAASLGIREAIDLILKGGVTTTAVPTAISGRGIGLDVVRELTARLKGQFTIETTTGKGTTVVICVPVSLTSLPALLVESNGSQVSIPLDCSRETLRVADSAIVRGATGECIVYGKQTIPFFPLSRVLKRAATQTRQHWSVVIVEAGAERMALGVDRLAGIATIVVRSLPALAGASRVVAGASLDGEGNPQLVLDPAGLMEEAARAQTTSRTDPAPRPHILVIDDSLTTRMVEQGILESAGYQVDLAHSGEEGIEKAHAHRYSLFLVDVEMPGMDGFEFVRRTRADPTLRDTQAVLVTSRSAPADRIRGEHVGARAYIVKSEFDQAVFLRTIEQLVGC